MREDVRAMWCVLLLAFCGFVTALMIFGHFQVKGRRESQEAYEHYRTASVALHTVYQKLMITGTNGANKVTVEIQSEDIKEALRRGINPLGELPEWVTDVYVSKGGVASTSGRFICLIAFGKRVFPLYGLTGTGECRYTRAGEVMEKDLDKDFTPLLRRLEGESR